jgi:Phosphotransferase enzyme family
MTQLTPELEIDLHRALTEVCDVAGLDPAGATLIKYTNNAVYRLHTKQVIIRLGSGEVALKRAQHVTKVARWGATHDAPIVRLLDGIEQPVLVDGYAATIWIGLPPADPAWTGAELAQPLRDLHQLLPPADFPDWDPFSSARRRLAAANGLSADDIAWLADRWAEAEGTYQRVRPDLAFGLLHGDAYLGNLLREPAGRFVLCDLDNTCRGPIDYDLAVAAVSADRFGAIRDHTDLAASYGRDITAQESWPLLRRIRELVLVTSVIPNLRDRPAIAEVHAHRLATLRTGQSTLWRRYQ